MKDKSTRRCVVFPDELWERIEAAAKKDDRSASWVVRRAVEDWLARARL